MIMSTTLKSIVKCEVSSLDENFEDTLYWSCIFLKHLNMSQLMKNVQQPSIYFDHVCHVRATKLYNLVLKVKEG